MRTIKTIDKENNGFVTSQELDDIIKVVYPELSDKYLVGLFKRFADPMNIILIAYRKFRAVLESDI